MLHSLSFLSVVLSFADGSASLWVLVARHRMGKAFLFKRCFEENQPWVGTRSLFAAGSGCRASLYIPWLPWGRGGRASPVPVRLLMTKPTASAPFSKTLRGTTPTSSSHCRQNAALAHRELGWVCEHFFSNLLLCT